MGAWEDLKEGAGAIYDAAEGVNPIGTGQGHLLEDTYDFGKRLVSDPSSIGLGDVPVVGRALGREKSYDPGQMSTEPLPDFQGTPTTGVNPGLTFSPLSASPKGKGRGAPIGDVKVEAKGQAPLAVQAAAAAARQQYVDALAVQYNNRAIGLGVQADILNDLAGGLTVNAAETYKKVDEIFTEAETQLQGVQELIDAARTNRVNPGQFFANVGDAGTFTSAIAVATGHLASALGGGPNTAYQIIQSAINRNVRAQEVNQLHDRAMVAHQVAFVDRLQALGVNRANVGNIHRAALTEVAKASLASVGAATASEDTRLGIDTLYAQLGAEGAASLVKAYEDITATATIKYHSMARADAAARVAANAARAAVEQQIAPQPVNVGRGTGMGGGRAPAAGGAAGAGRGSQFQMPEPRMENESAADYADRARKWFRSQVTAQGRLATEDEIKGYIAQFDPETQNALWQNTSEEGWQPVLSADQYDDFKIYQGPNRRFVMTARMRDLRDNDRAQYNKYNKRARNDIFIHGMFKQLDQILKTVTTSGKYLTFVDGKPQLTANLSDSQAYQAELLRKIVINIANMERTKLGSDAIRSISEWDVWKDIKTGAIDRNAMNNWIASVTRDPVAMSNFFRSQFRAAAETHDEVMQQEVLPFYHLGDPN